MKKKSIIKTIIKIVVILFILYNIIWLCFYFFYYRGFAKKIKADDIDSISEYTYSVGPPYYLGFVFNLSISETRVMTKEEKDISGLTTDLVIFPKLMGVDEYSIAINYITNENGDETEIGADIIMIDSEGNPLNTLNEEEQKHYTAQKESIEKIIKLAKEKWGI